MHEASFKGTLEKGLFDADDVGISIIDLDESTEVAVLRTWLRNWQS